MAGQGGQIHVIQPGLANLPLIPRKTAGLYDIERRAETGAKPYHGSDILGYIGLKQSDTDLIHLWFFKPLSLISLDHFRSWQYFEGTLETPFFIKHQMTSDTKFSEHGGPAQISEGATRRDFLFLTAGAFTAVGAGIVAWPFVDTLNPAKDTLALSTIDVDLAPIQMGQSITVMWRGKPVFIRHRTPEEIAAAKAVDVSTLVDKQTDDERVKKPEWLITVGICTHLGCVPVGQKMGEPRGEFGGWFCPCHGSQYDTSGRIRKGPAPKNLVVPQYQFTGDAKVKIG